MTRRTSRPSVPERAGGRGPSGEPQPKALSRGAYPSPAAGRHAPAVQAIHVWLLVQNLADSLDRPAVVGEMHDHQVVTFSPARFIERVATDLLARAHVPAEDGGAGSHQEMLAVGGECQRVESLLFLHQKRAQQPAGESVPQTHAVVALARRGDPPAIRRERNAVHFIHVSLL